MQQLKYFGSAMLSHEGDVDVRSHMKSTWCKWRELTGILCNKHMSSKLKSKVYKVIIRPGMPYGSECWPVRKRKELLHHTAKMRVSGGC